MKTREFLRLGEQNGYVFDLADLRTIFSCSGPSLSRVIRRTKEEGLLFSFSRGLFTTDPDLVDVRVLGQRLAPRGYVTGPSVLAEHGLVGTSPKGVAVLAHPAKGREYEGLNMFVQTMQLKPELCLGFSPHGFFKQASPEKAALDCLYFHTAGHRFPFDVYSDVDYKALDMHEVKSLLRLYRNPKFKAFACEVVGQ